MTERTANRKPSERLYFANRGRLALNAFVGVSCIVLAGCQSWSAGGSPMQSVSRVPPPGTGAYQLPNGYYNNTSSNVTPGQAAGFASGTTGGGYVNTANGASLAGFTSGSGPMSPATPASATNGLPTTDLSNIQPADLPPDAFVAGTRASGLPNSTPSVQPAQFTAPINRYTSRGASSNQAAGNMSNGNMSAPLPEPTSPASYQQQPTVQWQP